MRRLVVGGVTLLVAACSLFRSPAPGADDVNVANNTRLDVVVLVNGSPARVVSPGASTSIPATEPGPLPWHVEARTAGTGRLLISIDVTDGSVDVEGKQQQGVGSRADLSCGRLDVWVGPPMLGPAPGPGEPGDCEP